MQPIRVKPVEFIGCCPAHLAPHDEFQIVGLNLDNPSHSRVCFLAVSQLPVMVWQLQNDSRFFAHASCPGCTSQLAQENRVVFLLGHADKWELCQAISEYRRLCRQRPEPASAACLKAEAIEQQNRGDYSAATERMRAALVELKRAA